MPTAVLPPTRTERLFGAKPVTEADFLPGIEYAGVVCPKCCGEMTCVKPPVTPIVDGKSTGFQTVTWQCHNPAPGTKSGLCLMVSVVTDSVEYYMRPGDFDKGDIGWKAGVKDTIPAADVKPLVKSKQIVGKKAFEGVPVKPVYPGERATVNKILWDEFWNQIFANGEVDKNKLETYVRATATVAFHKVDNALKTLMQWIPQRTGYAVKLVDGKYKVTGKAAHLGGKGIIGLPFSDPEYRKVHGFPL